MSFVFISKGPNGVKSNPTQIWIYYFFSFFILVLAFHPFSLSPAKIMSNISSKCQNTFISYVFLFPKSSLHSPMFTCFLLIFGPPSPFILFSTFFLLILILFLHSLVLSFIFFLISTYLKHHINCQFSFMLSLSPLFFKFFFSSLKCYNFGLVHSFCLAYRNFVRHAGSGWHRAVFGMTWNKGFLCTGLSTGVKNSGHSGCNGMVFKTLPTTTQNKGEKNSFGEKVGEFWCHQTFPLCIM